MENLTDLTFGDVSATKTHDDAEKDLDAVNVSRWSEHDHDRLYINDLFSGRTDVYVDLVDESVTVSGTQVRSTSIDRTDDELVVNIKRPSWNYELAITAGPENDDASDGSEQEEQEDSDVDLERFGVDI